MKAHTQELVAATVRLISAARARDNTLGDPIRLFTVQAELAVASDAALAALVALAGAQREEDVMRDAPLAERDALAQDAARYRWLKTQALNWHDFMDGELFYAKPGEWDTVIDEAMHETPHDTNP